MNVATAQSTFLEKLAGVPLARSGGVALHRQTSDTLKRLLEESRYPAAIPLPPENDMARALGISRPTLRQAMARLSTDGVVHSQRGVGTFALRTGLVRPVGLSSLYQDLQASGQVPTTKVITYETVPAIRQISEELRIDESTPVLHLVRVRYSDGAPAVLTKSYLALPEGVKITRSMLERDGLYNLLYRVGSIELVGGTQVVSVRRADEQEAAELGLERGDPVMVAHRVAFDTVGRGIEYVHIVYPEGTELATDLRGTSMLPGNAR